ncbi:MAG: strawberry notch C-terminal domain-containing protein [Bacteroidota bacterium]
MKTQSPKQYYAKIDFGTRTPFWVLTNYMGDKGKHEYFTGVIIDESHVGYGKPVEFPASAVIKWNQGRPSGLGSPYIPATETCTILDTIVPDSMDYETHISIRKIKEAIGGNLTDYVCKKLKYTKDQLCKSLAAEQVDAVAMAIYNIEVRGQGMIVGDQTGIGKGRVAAAMIRYGRLAGHRPIFISEKPNLFSDIYRDIIDIGSDDGVAMEFSREAPLLKKINYKLWSKLSDEEKEEYGNSPAAYDEYKDDPENQYEEIFTRIKNKDFNYEKGNRLRPLIINAKGPKTNISDSNGNLIYTGIAPTELKSILEHRKMPAGYDVVLATYSQFNSSKSKLKRDFLLSIAKGNILIMDEAHNASGSSNTGEFMQNILGDCKGVVYLSATFAKRPDNMPIYAMKTAMSEANMSKESLVEAITRGGVALQEILSSQLVAEGQMLRRERSFDGVEVNYITLDQLDQEHKAISDNITSIIRQIIAFQADHVEKVVEEMDTILAAEGKQLKERGGTAKGGVDNTPYFSKVFNVINQMLFAVKASAVADRAIVRLKEGKKPIIAFSSTMGSFLETMENERGNEVSDGDVINADFKTVLMRGLNGVLRYTEKDQAGKPEYKKFELSELSPEAKSAYYAIADEIKKVSTGIVISPIDLIIQKIQKAGYTVAEVTGRKMEIRFKENSTTGVVLSRKRLNTNDAFRLFNNNDVDALMINQSGSTGASAHAIITDKVSRDRVKQRVMIILQTELNINTEVQKRGRINRTGQIYKPIYDYVSSAIPAERRLMMMMQKKLKSLDANTTSNQKQSENVVNVDDFLNKYGDQVVHEYLMEKRELNDQLDDPLDLNGDNKDGKDIKENIAAKVSGRVAVLPTDQQELFYSDIIQAYNDKIEYLKQTGDYDLEVEIMNLEAETIEAKSAIVGKGGDSIFGTDSVLEKCMCNVLKKPFTKIELDNILRESLKGETADDIKNSIRHEYKSFVSQKLQDDIDVQYKKYDKLISAIVEEKGYKKFDGDSPGNIAMRQQYIRERTESLEQARDKAIEKEEDVSRNRFQTMDSHFSYFTIGEGYVFPFPSFDMGEIQVPSIFLGFAIDRGRSNPFAPSAVKAKFALSDSHKYISLVCSGDQGEKLRAVRGTTSPWMTKNYYSQWDQYIGKSSVNRKHRYIVTGNILQAAPAFKGNLISYTTNDGGIKKGILMPENWSNENHRGESFITIPIKKAKGIILSINEGGSIATTNGIVFENPHVYSNNFNRNRQAPFMMIIPKSGVYGPVFKNLDLMRLCVNTNDGFVQRGNKMTAYFTTENMGKAIDILQDKFTLSVKVNPKDYDLNVSTGSGDSNKDPITVRAEAEFSKDKDKFEKRKFDEKQHQAKPPVVNASLELLKAKAKARLRLLILKKRGIKI